ncbi:hypothetical protein COLO4_06320 [Corchorus olitorius]|uniref:Uncharacterized protein n=1 Tax=Corchorus olitorius TaxID=93759 RepID=A0A1R3KNF3_9ROSI|nr:hypothetical protein COLO4_06320 [Corchorus olitorius]
MQTVTEMKELSETKEEQHEEAAAFAIWDCGSPLYDSYELASLSHLIERHLMKLPPSLGGSKRLTARFSHHPFDVTVTPATISVSTSNTRAKESSSSSLISSFSLGGFLGSKFWKRRRFGQSKDKPKRLKTRLCCFCNKAGYGKNRTDY